jgi:hypothetical protein
VIAIPLPLDLSMPNPLLTPLLRWFRRLSYPKLFALTALLFVANLFILDPLPFVDELLLGLGTILLANWKDRSKKPSEESRPEDIIEGESRRR